MRMETWGEGLVSVRNRGKGAGRKGWQGGKCMSGTADGSSKWRTSEVTFTGTVRGTVGVKLEWVQEKMGHEKLCK